MTSSSPSQPDRAAVDEAARAWIAALRETESMPPEARDPLWQRIERGTVGERDEPVTPGRPVTRRPRVAGLIVVGLALAAGLTLMLMYGPQRLTPGAPEPSRVEAPYGHVDDADGGELVRAKAPGASRPRPERPPSIDTDASTHSARPQPVDPALGGRAQDTSAGSSADTSARRGPRPRRPEPDADASGVEVEDPERGAASLAAETAALRGARAALAADDPARALELLASCARRFPDGHLKEERGALRVVALCAAGKRAQGRAEAKWFEREYPGSALTARVRAACPSP